MKMEAEERGERKLKEDKRGNGHKERRSTRTQLKDTHDLTTEVKENQERERKRIKRENRKMINEETKGDVQEN